MGALEPVDSFRRALRDASLTSVRWNSYPVVLIRSAHLTTGFTYTQGVGQDFRSGENGSYWYTGQDTGPGVVIEVATEHFSRPDDTIFYNWDRAGYFVPLADFMTGDISVYHNGYSAYGCNSDGSVYVPLVVKTLTQQTIWPDGPAFFLPDSTQMTFSSGFLYADGTIIDLYVGGQNSSNGLPYCVQIVRWKGKRSNLGVLGGFNITHTHVSGTGTITGWDANDTIALPGSLWSGPSLYMRRDDITY